ncbi:hypothetical protein [Haloarchaeobius amylolyticus]|uniref:hypothetical protein n=1 Tax=Haloarchaeobius amylolyticus TaxID=1198296 RepID=UPI00226E3D9B|nr:hypothetical protein [Haloarchaeobius amylolyticus]
MSNSAGSPLADLDPVLLGRGAAALAGVLGLVFLASPLFLLTTAAADPEVAEVALIIQSTAVAFGLTLVAVAWVDRHGQSILAAAGPAGLAVVLLVTGPVLGYAFGVFSWAGLLLASVFVAGIPGIWKAYQAQRTA